MRDHLLIDEELSEKKIYRDINHSDGLLRSEIAPNGDELFFAVGDKRGYFYEGSLRTEKELAKLALDHGEVKISQQAMHMRLLRMSAEDAVYLERGNDGRRNKQVVKV